MPAYDFKCDACRKIYEIQMKLAEHAELKDKLTCQECNGILTQCISKIPFQLKGSGWFSGGSSTMENIGGYDMTQTELNRNLDMERRIEDTAYEMQYQDQKNQ